MNRTLYAWLLVLLASLTAACHRGEGVADGEGVYTLRARVATDSTVSLSHLVLLADSHVSLRADSLELGADSTCRSEQVTPGLDEFYLCADGGELCRGFAMAGMEVSVRIEGCADSLVARFEPTPTDSLNPWLEQQHLALDSLKPADRCMVIDSLCHALAADVRCALLLRDEVDRMSDSLAVRRCLGALRPEAKPEWLVRSIEERLTSASRFLWNNHRLTAAKFQVNDSTVFDMAATRSDYLLVFCWADYDTASVDSLRVLARLMEDDYYMKRLQLLDICLSAADSASWQQQVKGLPGMHVWLPAGLADPRIRRWSVDGTPFIALCDMYNNQQHRLVWGGPLRNALTRLANRSGFSHTPKTRPHGR